MLIGIYSDLHVSRNSSILPLYINDDKDYSYRLHLCQNTLKYIHKIFKQENVDLIVNCGDTFDSHTISSDVASIYLSTIESIILKDDYDIYEDILIGNHDMYNKRFNISCISNLSKYMNTVNGQKSIFSDYCKCDIYELSYNSSKDFSNEVLKLLDKYPRKYDKAILFMHGDINGSKLNSDIKINDGISQQSLLEYFDIIINGHIHTTDILYDKNDKQIINIGSCMSHNFSDDDNHIGKFYIFDTECMRIIKEFINPYQVLFRTWYIFNKDSLINYLNNLETNVDGYVLKIVTNEDLQELIDNRVKKSLGDFNCLKIKYIIRYDITKKEDNSEELYVINNDNIQDDFLKFLQLNNKNDKQLIGIARNILCEINNEELK